MRIRPIFPGRELDHIVIKDVLDTLKNYGDKCKINRMTKGEMSLQKVLTQLDAGMAAALEDLTLKDMVSEATPDGDNSDTSDDSLL